MKDNFKFIKKFLFGLLICSLIFETVMPAGIASAVSTDVTQTNVSQSDNMPGTGISDTASYETAKPNQAALPDAGNGEAENSTMPEKIFKPENTNSSVKNATTNRIRTFSAQSKKTSEKYAVVHSDIGLNIRENPGTKSDIIGRLGDREKVKYLGSAKASDGSVWYKLECPFGIGYGHSDYLEIVTENIPEYKPDKNFENSIADFPASYKDALRNLHALYPNWRFIADHTGLSWDSVINKEANPVTTNLIHHSEPDSRKSVEPGAYNPLTNKYKSYDSGGWVPAHVDTIKYYMDPRNFLSGSSVFQFMSNKYDPATANVANMKSVVRGTFLDAKFPTKISDKFFNNFKKSFPNEKADQNNFSYSQVILLVGKVTGVNPMVIASIIIQEQGSNGLGNCINQDRVIKYPYLKPYAGYYNHFNIGAYASNGKSAIENGLIYAVNHNWSSVYKSILGGAQWFGDRYVKNNKYNTYLKKFNVKNGLNSVGVGQYMTNVRGAYDEGCRLYNGYKNLLDKKLTFTIPVYTSMPSTSCKLPSSSGSNINYLKNLTAKYKVSGKEKELSLSPHFDPFTYEYSMTVPNDATRVHWYPAVSDQSAKYYIYDSDKYDQVSIPVGTHQVKIRITSSTGKNRYYKINVTRKGGTNPPAPAEKPDKVTGITVKPDYTLLKISYNKSKDKTVTGYRIAIRELYDNASKGQAAHGDWEYINTPETSVLIKSLERGGHYEIRVAAVNTKENIRSSYSSGITIYTNRGGDRPAIMKTPRITKMTTTSGTVTLTAREIVYKTAPQHVTYRYAYRKKGTKKWTYINTTSHVRKISGLTKGKIYTFAVGYYYTSALDNKTRVYSKFSEYKDLKIK